MFNIVKGIKKRIIIIITTYEIIITRIKHTILVF